MTTRLVYIAAIAARTCVGLSAAATSAAVRAGVTRIKEHPAYLDAQSEPLYCARDPGIDVELLGVDRVVALASQTLTRLIERLTHDSAWHGTTSVHLSLPETRPGFSPADAELVMSSLARTRHDALGSLRVERSGLGHAGALLALQSAVHQVADRRADLAIVAGADSYLQPDTLDWLEQEQRVAHAGARAGFAPGEGAAMLAVASEAALKRLRLPGLARVRAVACATELRKLDSGEGLLGEGLTTAVLEATRELQLPDERITDLYGDINGERHRTEDWGFTVLRCPHLFRDPTDYITSAGSCGDVGAATTALGCILAVHAWQRRYAKGERALVWAGSWGGLRGAAVLEKGLV